MNSAEMSDNFREHGFVTDQVFSKEDLSDFVLTFKELLDMQLRKLSIERCDDINKAAVALSNRSSQALSEVLMMARHTSAGHKLSSSEILRASSHRLLSHQSKISEKALMISGPSFFVNIPDNNARKYTWHAEQNWYPKRRNFLNVWCPILLDRIEDNSMMVMSGSHKKDWFYFSEYSGYGGAIDESANVQYEIPSTFLSDYTAEIPPVNSGEGLFFSGNLVHRSLDNVSKKTLFAMVFRLFDYSEDLTLSSNWADLPYNRKTISVPEINVKT